MVPPLADAGAQALVGSMGTDVWAATKSGFAFLLGDGSEEAIPGWEERLEESATRVGAGATESETTAWRDELRLLLANDPEVESKLAALVDEIASRLASGGGAL